MLKTMRKYTALFVFLFALSLSAQSRFPPINLYGGDPTGITCSNANALLQSSLTGLLYSCQGGVYGPATGVDINPGGGFAIPAYSSTTGKVVSPSQVAVDSTLKSLSVPGAVNLGSGASGCSTGCLSFIEGSTAGTPTTGMYYIRADSTTHQLLCSLNGGAETNACFSGGGSGGVNPGTTFKLPAYASTTNVGPSNVLFDSTLNNLLIPGNIQLAGGSTGCGTATGCVSFNENNTTGTPAAGVDYCRGDSGAHQLVCSFNGVAEAPIVAGQASGVIPLGSTSTSIGAQSHMDDGVTNSGEITSSETFQAPIQDKGGQVFNVKTFGAKGDGTTDDDLAIQNATNAAIAAGGGTVFIPKGNYFVNSTHANANAYIWAQSSHMHFVCDPGAQLITPTTGTPTLFYLGYPTTGIQTKAGYQANTLSYTGSPTITLTAPTDTSNFAVGDPIYILGAPSHESNGDGEINVITAINSTTGVLTLQQPTSKIYTGNNSNVGAPGIVTVINGRGLFFTDESIEGCTALNIAADFAFFGQIMGGKMLNNTVTVTPASGRGMMINSFYPMSDIEVAGNKYTMASNSALWQLADGFRDIYVHHNTFISPYGNTILNPSQGIINLHISNNNLYLTFPTTPATNTAAINFSTAYNVTVDHNHIFVGNLGSQGSNVFNMSLSNGACNNCIVDSNEITGYNVSSLFATGAAPGIIFKNNIMTCTACHTVLNIQSGGGVYTGNRIQANAPLNNLLYIVSITGGQDVFANNFITQDAPVTNVPGIRVGTSAGVNTLISNNYVLGTNRGIQIDSGSPTTIGNVCDTVTSFTANCGLNLSGVTALGTTAIAAGSCATLVTTTATGVLSTDTVTYSGGYTIAGLTITAYTTANNVNFLVCNPSAASITPPAASAVWRVIR